MELEPITRQEKIIAGKDLQPVTRMEFFLKAYGGGGSGGGAQPDWNQNDDTQPDYVKNRTHWVGDAVETVLIPEQSIIFDGGSASSPVVVRLIEGNTYVVSFDGTTYQVSCKFHNLSGTLYIGNGAKLGQEDTGEPFIYGYRDNLGAGFWFSYADGNEHTISLIEFVKTIHKLDSKFIPWDKNSVVPNPVYIDVSDAFDNWSEDRYDEIKAVVIEALLKGSVMWIKEPDASLYSMVLMANIYDYNENYVNIDILSYDLIGGYEHRSIQTLKIKPSGVFKGSKELYNDFLVASPSGKAFKITVDDNGTLTATEITA